MTAKPHPHVCFGVLTATLAALVVAGCGGSSSSSHSSSAATGTPVTSASSTSTTTAARPSRPLRLHIVSPRAGAHTAQNLTVRVALTGTASGRVHSFRYVLDGVLTRHGDARLAFHGLAPGRQHLVVSVPGDRGLQATEVFVVRAPPAPVAPAPVASTPAPTAPSTMTTPAPTTPAPTTAAPPPATTTPAAPAPAPASGIPQGGGGDMDGDNSGGPSDGDG